MSEYQLELKQIVEYPRCRIYRHFIRTLMSDRNIRVSDGSGLFYYAVLCSYANFRTSYKSIGGISYTIYPGEWVCKIEELTDWFRCKYQYQAVALMNRLQNQRLITFSRLGRDKVIKFKITGWHKHNTVLDYNAPCQKDTGFFFMPISIAAEIISTEICSEMDILIDLWMNTVYNDEQVNGSKTVPVVYMRNGSGSPLISYSELGERWGLSKSTVSRLLKKMSGRGYLSVLTFPGRHGSIISLCGYLSAMFQISDVMIDKDEIAMCLNIKLSVSDDGIFDESERMLSEEQLRVSKEISIVSKSIMRSIVEKVAEILSTQGVPCFGCSESQYILSPLSDCRDVILNTNDPSSSITLLLTAACSGEKVFNFELRLFTKSNKVFGGRYDEK